VDRFLVLVLGIHAIPTILTTSTIPTLLAVLAILILSTVLAVLTLFTSAGVFVSTFTRYTKCPAVGRPPGGVEIQDYRQCSAVV
jgi:hypothetical protein